VQAGVDEDRAGARVADQEGGDRDDVRILLEQHRPQQLQEYPQAIVDNVARSIPLQRTGRAEEMAWLVAYLASPAGDFYSGTTITLDGARDNWAGPWPSETIAGESSEPPAEERR
jgi:NAD(P)-dependent dehydrogenase (short-subunit alcohol dehydrogenase family)